MRDLVGREFKEKQWIVVNAPCMNTSDRSFRIAQVLKCDEATGKLHYAYWDQISTEHKRWIRSWCKPKYAMVLGTLEGVPQYVNG